MRTVLILFSTLTVLLLALRQIHGCRHTDSDGLRFLSRKWQAKDQLSDRWRRQQDYAEGRNRFQGVCWRWPINKLLNEASTFNTQRLRKSA